MKRILLLLTAAALTSCASPDERKEREVTLTLPAIPYAE
jgi:hypothetical protein